MEIKDNKLVPIILLTTHKQNFKNLITTERDKKLDEGFMFTTFNIQADNIAQSNAHALFTKGIRETLTYPVTWRTKDNQYLYLNTLEELETFADSMLAFVQSVYLESWVVKDAIELATNITEMEALYNAYRKVPMGEL